MEKVYAIFVSEIDDGTEYVCEIAYAKTLQEAIFFVNAMEKRHDVLRILDERKELIERQYYIDLTDQIIDNLKNCLNTSIGLHDIEQKFEKDFWQICYEFESFNQDPDEFIYHREYSFEEALAEDYSHLPTTQEFWEKIKKI